MIETVVALCMFYQGGIIEHTYKETMSDCLRSKRVASREVKDEPEGLVVDETGECESCQ